MSRIIVNSSAQTENGDRVANANIGIITAMATIKQLGVITDLNVNGSDYSEVESEFGLPVGAGAEFAAMLSACITALDDVAITAFISRVGRR